MNRPAFNKFAKGDPTQDYNRRMREYIVWLEVRAKKCDQLEQDRWYTSKIVQDLHRSQLHTFEISKSMKILRSQIRAMFKEGSHASK